MTKTEIASTCAVLTFGHGDVVRWPQRQYALVFANRLHRPPRHLEATEGEGFYFVYGYEFGLVDGPRTGDKGAHAAAWFRDVPGGDAIDVDPIAWMPLPSAPEAV